MGRVSVYDRGFLLAAVSLLSVSSAAAAQSNASPAPSSPGGGTSTSAQAETAAPTNGGGDQEVVVTGYRQSLRTAINQKRNADRVQEVLSAEDLGKLPEASIAESLARLPGLATNRDRGNGTQISIRGLGPNLVNTLLNGREIVSAEANRNIRYDDYPAELLNGAYVFKSPTASQVEGAIAGQVDLQTVRPLDQKSRRIAINVRASYNDLADDISDTKPLGYIGSISYVDQFADNTLGIALGYSGRRQANATARTNIFRSTNSFQDINGDGRGAAGNAPNVYDNIPYGYEALVRGGDDIRHGAMAAVQWRPGAGNFELNGDFFYSRVKFDETQRGVRVLNLPFGNAFSNATVVDGNVTGITASNNTNIFGLDVRNVNEQFFFKDNLYAGGLNAKYKADDWTLTGDVGYSKTHRDQQFLSLVTEYSATNPPFTYQDSYGTTSSFLATRGNPASMSFDRSLTDPSINRIANFEIPTGTGAPLINDKLLTLKGDIQRDLNGSFLKSIVIGTRYTDRTKDLTSRSQYSGIDAANRVPVDADLLNSPVTFPGAFGNLPQTMSINIPKAINRLLGTVDPTETIYDQAASWVVGEKTYAGYIQGNIDMSLGDMPLTGNVGVRVVHTKTTSSSTKLDGTNSAIPPILTPFTVTNAFTDWLPNLNLTLKVSPEVQIRFGASKAIARAPLDDLNAGSSTYSGSTGVPELRGGNPLLEPFRAKQLDLTFEWYFDRDSALTISGFYKKLDTFIATNTTTTRDANGIPTGTFTQPINGKGGEVKGVEVLFQKAFTFLPKPLDGLGVYLNYSYTDSNISVQEADNAIGPIALPGLSKHVANATLYYSKSGFEARIAYRYRSAYATELGDTDRILYTAPEGVLDFQTSYTFGDGSRFKGLQILAQASNLTNEPFETYYGDRRLQGRFEKFGRRFMLGAGINF
ncbi:TonB-dependent receptor [Sphingomonas sp.]|uniref:TonB-dependent receptor n=1 Tax=Sphingomonas sp. TaxID=28214 RepID=UPI003B3B63AB